MLKNRSKFPDASADAEDFQNLTNSSFSTQGTDGPTWFSDQYSEVWDGMTNKQSNRRTDIQKLRIKNNLLAEA